MQVIGMKEVSIDWLRLPGDFRARLTNPNVIELGNSMDSVGQLHEPVVRASDHLLIAGGDRVAAHVVRKLDKVLVKLIDCTDDEAEEIRIVENIRRRHDPERNAQELERLLALYSGRGARSEDPLAADDHGRVPEKTPIGEARAKVAKLKGVKPESVRKAQQRHRERRENREAIEQAKEAQAVGMPADLEKVPSPIADLGFELKVEWLADVGKVKAVMENAAAQCTLILGRLTTLSNGGLPFSSARLQRLRSEVSALGATFRGCVPKSLCPYCKGQPELQPGCTACVGLGYITDSQWDHVPQELWQPDKAWKDGKVITLDFDAPTPPVVVEAGDDGDPLSEEGGW